MTCLFRLSNLCIPALTENIFTGEKSPSSRLALVLKSQNSSFVKKGDRPEHKIAKTWNSKEIKYIFLPTKKLLI